MPLLRRAVHLAHCTHAPLLDPVRDALERYLATRDAGGVAWGEWTDEVEGARAAFARLVGGNAEDVAVSASVTAATAGVASALEPGGRRRVVVATEAEFPTVGHVWQAWSRLGLEVRWVPERRGVVETEEAMAAIDERTLLVSLTHASHRTGVLLDVPAIAAAARERGALVYVDAYQTVGTRPLDVAALSADFLAAGSHKFLLGVPGIAFLYVRPEVARAARPALTGWYGQAPAAAGDPRRLEWAAGARRFELGTPPVPAAYAARAGMEVLLAVGPERVGAWLDLLCRRLLAGGVARGLEPLGTGDPARRAATAAFRVPDPPAVEEALRRSGFLVSARGEGVRIAPHFYTLPEEVDAVLDALAAAAALRS